MSKTPLSSIVEIQGMAWRPARLGAVYYVDPKAGRKAPRGPFHLQGRKNTWISSRKKLRQPLRRSKGLASPGASTFQEPRVTALRLGEALRSVEWTRRVVLQAIFLSNSTILIDSHRFSTVFGLKLKAPSPAERRGPWCCGRRHFWWARDLRKRVFERISWPKRIPKAIFLEVFKIFQAEKR